MKVILFGSTGMIGQGVLRECLKNEQVESVLAVNRSSCNITHAKLKEVIHVDLYNLAPVAHLLKGYDACFYCIGITSAGISATGYYKNTFELTTSIAQAVLEANKGNKNFTMCYISGAGTDSSEDGRIMWARVKGKTENALFHMPFKSAYMFRPAFIQPLHGIKSRTKLYNAMYTVLKPFYFILKHAEVMVTNTETLGKAMINAAAKGYKKRILESKDINLIGK